MVSQGILVLLCMLGISVCIYALSVEFHVEANPEYEAMCDINDKMSCTKVLTSEYGKGFGLLGQYHSSLFVKKDMTVIVNDSRAFAFEWLYRTCDADFIVRDGIPFRRGL